MNTFSRGHRIPRIAGEAPGWSITHLTAIISALRQFLSKRFSLLGAMLILMLGHADSAWAQAYCFPANWWGFDLVSAANGQATMNDKTCGCGSSSKYVDGGGGCNAGATTRTSSAASNGASWAVQVRSDYFSSCGNTTNITVSGSCKLTGKSQWYSVVATCSDHNTSATVTMDSTVTPLAPCVIEYMADSDYFNTVYVRDEIKFKNAITVTTPAPSYAAIGTSFNVVATALVGSVTISTTGNCTATSTGSGTATITMTGTSSADCVVNYTSGSDATYGADAVTSNTNNNYYEGAYAGIKLNWSSFWLLDGFMTCGPTCAVTAGNSHAWLGVGTTSYPGETGRTYGMLDADNPNDTWIIKVATGTGADTTYTIGSVVNQKCLAKSGTYLSFAACNAADTAQQWTIAPYNGSNPSDAPAGVELALPAYPGLWANISLGWYSYKFGMSVTADHDWTSAFFLGGKTSPPDHIRFEFNPNAALTCQPLPVTIKACANAACSSLFSASSMTLTPGASKGTWQGLTAAPSTSFVGSSSGIKLDDTTAGDTTTFSYTISASSPLAISPANTTLECYDTSTSTVMANCNAVATFGSCTFKAVEVGADPAINPDLYTKLAGVPFSFDVVGPTAYTGNITVDLVDASAAAWSCPSTPTTLVSTAAFTAPSSATGSIVSTLASGRKTFTLSNTNPVKNVRVRIRDAYTPTSNCYNSSDNFTIRPTSLDIALSNPGVNPLIAGQSGDGKATAFRLTATARVGWTGTSAAGSPTGTATAGYIGKPTAAWVQMNDWLGNALPANADTTSLFTGSFSAGGGVTATGNFYFDDFGWLDLNRVNTVVDTTFTSASSDQANGDCDTSSGNEYLNTLNASGKYGCYVRSTAPTPSPAKTDRFRPYTYAVSSGVTAACNGFTYFGQPFGGGGVTLTAKSGSGTKMSRLTGTALNTVATPYPPGYYVTPYNNPPFPGIVSAIGGLSIVSKTAVTLPATQASTWTSGEFKVDMSASSDATRYFANKPTSSSGPYDQFVIAVTVNDHDSIFIGSCADNAGNGGSISTLGTTSTCLPPASGVLPGPATTTTKLRLGMLRLGNAYGSELLPLYVPVKALYWNGTLWTPATDDTCTTVPVSRIASGNFKGSLSSLGALTATAFSGGAATVAIPAPGAGVTGSADIAINLGSTGTSSSCAGALSGTTGAADMSWLRGNWCSGSYDKDPSARITFGAAKSPYLYRREKY